MPLLAMLGLVPVLAAMTDIDLRLKIIPDLLNLALAVLGVLYVFLGNDGSFEEAVWQIFGGVLLYGGFALALRFVFQAAMKKEALGLGDVKFFAATGIWLGASLELFTVFLFVSGIAGVFLALGWRKATGEREFPFGPSLIMAFVAALLYGNLWPWPLSL